MKVEGQCHCGAIVYEAEVELGTVGVCHCLDCQRLQDSRSVRTFGQRLPASAFSRDSRSTTSKRAIAGQSAFIRSVRSCASPIYSCAIENPQSYASTMRSAVGHRLYCASVTCSIQSTGEPFSFSWIAMWLMAVVGVAPCQCFSPGANHTTSPGRISSMAPPSR